MYFLRHGKLDLPYSSHDVMPFEVLADLASGQMDPPVDEKATREFVRQTFEPLGNLGVTAIYSGPSRRSRETAALIKQCLEENGGGEIATAVLSALREIDFDLRRIYKVLPSKIDITDVNRKVFEAMVSGEGAEVIGGAGLRVQEIFRTTGDLGTNAVLVTHDFLVRVIELYIRRAGALGAVSCDDLLGTRRNLYLQGFATENPPSALVFVPSDRLR